jgi:small nuclear ribonucleoprotein (snRNP)-like protein
VWGGKHKGEKEQMAGSNNNNNARAQKGGGAAEVAGSSKKATSAFLGSEVRLALDDGRYLTGLIASFQGNGDLILLNVTEFREFTAEMNHGVKETGIKQSGLVAIPFHHIVTMHKRVDGHVPITDHINERLAQQQSIAEN